MVNQIVLKNDDGEFSDVVWKFELWSGGVMMYGEGNEWGGVRNLGLFEGLWS
jgi:hypothetical protein